MMNAEEQIENGNQDLVLNLITWIDSYFVNRNWKPNKQFLAEHLIDHCELETPADIINASGNGVLESGVKAFEQSMLQTLKEIEHDQLVE